uniref:EOG090X08BF n=1 Tax=Lynceus sp. MCZ IZ 141354 TaxID=1930659 RepID=A0A9N6WT55_9CRUS|nr:EOG090X08BF [Lynceus sp. MCZ IZ 141354]
MASRLDQVYRSLILSKFFTKGWGKPENIQRLFDFRKSVSNRDVCQYLVDKNHPVIIEKEEIHSDAIILEGHFESPFAQHLPGLVPLESEKAYFQILLPRTWKWKNNLKPVCLQLAGTGDHYFWRRRTLMAKPLLKEHNIASILLENPFYGLRKPKDQVRSSLHNVSDIFVMGGCLVLESLVLFNWCEKNNLGPLGLTGVSMGGHMASLAASNWHKPTVLVPCLSWSTASGVFTKGVMSGAIDWSLLENQFMCDSFYSEILQRILESPDNCAYQAGRNFAQTYSNESLSRGLNNGKLSSALQRTFNFAPLESSALPLMNKLWNWFPHFNKSSSVDGNVDISVAMNPPRPNWSNLGAVERAKVRQEALEFMRGIMDEFTHISNYSTPVDTELITIIAAENDAYVPRDGATDLRTLWPGCQMKYVKTGHVAAYLLHHKMFREAVKDGFNKLIDKYYTDSSSCNLAS